MTGVLYSTIKMWGRNMRRIFLTFLFINFGFILNAAAEDVAGSDDHPVLTRYPGSEIKWYDVQAYVPYAVATGPVAGYQGIDDWEEISGRTTRIYYETAGQKTHLDVFLNYKQALEEADFSTVAEGSFAQSSRANEIGSRKWIAAHYKRNQPPPVGIRLLQGSSTSGGTAYFAAKKERAAGTVYVVIGIAQYSQDIVATMIDVIEIEEAETGLITVDAEAIGNGITEYGRVILDGLQFEFDSAVLKAESKPVLDEIAEFLNNHPEMKFYVVGHTDAVGTITYNQTLSGNRAGAVVNELVENYGITKDRLEPHGVGPLAPVFSNSTDAGKGKNRRVELVERQ